MLHENLNGKNAEVPYDVKYTDSQLMVHSLASRHCCDVHSQLGTIRASAGGSRALHSDLVGEITCMV